MAELRAGQLAGICACALLAIGVIMIGSADLMVAPVENATTPVAPASISNLLISLLTGRTGLYMAMAVAALVVGCFFPVRLVARWVRERWSGRGVLPMFAVVVGLLLAFCALVYVPGIRDVRNGASRWIALGSRELSMQPSEVAKWALLPIVAWYCTVRAGRMRDFTAGLLPVLLAVGAVSGFIILEDLGTGVLVGAAACVLLLCAGARWWHFALPGVVAVGLVVAAIATSDYRMNRVKSFLDPYAHPETIGFHTIQGLVAIQNGGGVGLGLGEGIQKRGYLPEDRTDYIFAVICEELGVAGAAMVVTIYLGLLWAGFTVARREVDPFLRLWAMGVTATVGLQATINLLVVTGLAPAKGIALPMISYGGTGWILTAFSVGVLMAIDSTQPRMTLAGVPRSQATNPGKVNAIGGDEGADMHVASRGVAPVLRARA